MDLGFLLAHGRGVVRTAQLMSCGLTPAAIRTAVRSGVLCAVRRGWYATPDADPTVLRAVRAGGVLSCLSALRMHGYWTPPSAVVHLRRTEHGRYRTAAARPAPDVHDCSLRPADSRPSGSVDGSLTALRFLPGCVSDEELIAVIDSMLNQRRVAMSDIRAALSEHPARVRELVDRCDGRAESGTESLVRVRLRRRNLKVTPQVLIPGVGRVDLLLGNRSVIEVDSRAHHTDLAAYENDRRRDLILTELGYQPIRLTYHRVLHDWAAIEQSLLVITGRGDHRRGGPTLGRR